MTPTECLKKRLSIIKRKIHAKVGDKDFPESMREFGDLENQLKEYERAIKVLDIAKRIDDL